MKRCIACSNKALFHIRNLRLRGRLYCTKRNVAMANDSSISIVWDGVSISGCNVQVAAAYNIDSKMACYLTPKAPIV